MEPFIKIYINKDQWPDKFETARETEVGEFVWKRHLTNKHKHEAPPAFSLRNFCD